MNSVLFHILYFFYPDFSLACHRFQTPLQYNLFHYQLHKSLPPNLLLLIIASHDNHQKHSFQLSPHFPVSQLPSLRWLLHRCMSQTHAPGSLSSLHRIPPSPALAFHSDHISFPSRLKVPVTRLLLCSA